MYQNVLQHLAGLLHLHIDPVLNHMVVEVVELLRDAGVRNREQWLDLVEDTKASPAVLAAIASNALPFQGILSSISSKYIQSPKYKCKVWTCDCILCSPSLPYSL
ncbi:hypothetical protein Pmani_000812 [Petrolisthes manimaculis]|uniref:Uncharacterized protein n=1 Tax=Petrolisthes manimaculis TaxID=1843537 RepID=A0AAE1UPZ3_9EUCA|nr:hypothetical protein Pmani_002899 [Petrolisthes manimaculis]KAK4326589.1 hypothetical protein Pmani_002903 [Petrolisthes manimaculis]KAK4328792.1 hypothetical protein Pmani_000812 [Petrolisthes manimaculis]